MMKLLLLLKDFVLSSVWVTFLHQVVICAQSFIKQPNVLGALFKSFRYMVKISHRLLPCGELTFDMQPAYKDIISHGLCLFL